MAQSKVFSKDNFKGLTPELQQQIIQRFNDYDTLIRVMKSTSNNLKTLLQTTNGIDARDRQDINATANILHIATSETWLKENHDWY
jgi:hypothetical protein